MIEFASTPRARSILTFGQSGGSTSASVNTLTENLDPAVALWKEMLREPGFDPKACLRGAYVVREATGGAPDLVIVATGSDRDLRGGIRCGSLLVDEMTVAGS